MPSTVDFPLLKVQQLLASPAAASGPTLYFAACSLLAWTVWQFVAARPPVPKNAPKLWNAYDWPLVGSAIRFYSRRRDMVMEGLAASPSGNFSFYIGRKHVVILSGPGGRKTYYDNKALNFSAGFVELLAGMPFTQEADATEGEWPRYFNKTLVTMIRPDILSAKLPVLRRDVRAACDRLAAQAPSTSADEWRVTDAFDSIYHLIFRLLTRIVGATEVSEDPVLSRRMLSVFEKFERSNSTTGIIFPWLRVFTPAYLLRMALGTVLYLTFQRIIRLRKRTGRREEDALQYLLDQNTPLDVIIKFQISATWAALLTTASEGTYLLLLLASHPGWLARCRKELAELLETHRTSSSQSVRDILETLPLTVWETGLPVLDACLRETLRVAMPGAVFRRNLSGKDVVIEGGKGKVVPNGSFVAFLVDEVHMDPIVYEAPGEFNPGRFLGGGFGGKVEGKGAHEFVGWGSGRHPCLGMRLAKLEISLLVAYFITTFDFELSDKHGNQSSGKPQLPHRNEHTAVKSRVPVYLRYKPRG